MCYNKKTRKFHLFHCFHYDGMVERPAKNVDCNKDKREKERRGITTETVHIDRCCRCNKTRENPFMEW